MRGCFRTFGPGRVDSASCLPFAWCLVFVLHAAGLAQSSTSLGIGQSAAAAARGGNNVAQPGIALDAVEGNPAGLTGVSGRVIDGDFVLLVAGGSFRNAVNPHAGLSGVGGALPYGVFAAGLDRDRWVVSAGATPEILIRANWHYYDTPGTAGVTYGYQRQETETIAIRSSAGVARNFGPKWSAGVTLGLVYNRNDLNAPYIFQQQPALQGLKVLLSLGTHGHGWNGSAGVQWHPYSRLRAGLAWKSGTTIRTEGDANGTASALFSALGLKADPAFHYHAQVINHLSQACDGGIFWQGPYRVDVFMQGDFTAWAQAFASLPITLSGGTNSVINGVVGASGLRDSVPLRWSNQGSVHAGVERHVRELTTLRAGYSYASNPVPKATLTPLTAAIMQNTLSAGGGWTRGRWHYDLAYQAQLPAVESVGRSALVAGEYNDSRVRVWTQSITVSAGIKF